VLRGRISGAQLAALFSEHKSKLFGLNIRNYIGDNGTNKTIRKTALEAADDFFFFNTASQLWPRTSDTIRKIHALCYASGWQS